MQRGDRRQDAGSGNSELCFSFFKAKDKYWKVRKNGKSLPSRNAIASLSDSNTFSQKHLPIGEKQASLQDFYLRNIGHKRKMINFNLQMES